MNGITMKKANQTPLGLAESLMVTTAPIACITLSNYTLAAPFRLRYISAVKLKKICPPVIRRESQMVWTCKRCGYTRICADTVSCEVCPVCGYQHGHIR